MVRITISSEHGDDTYRAALAIKRQLDNHYASTNQYSPDGKETIIIDCFPFAVND